MGGACSTGGTKAPGEPIGEPTQARSLVPPQRPATLHFVSVVGEEDRVELSGSVTTSSGKKEDNLAHGDADSGTLYHHDSSDPWGTQVCSRNDSYANPTHSTAADGTQQSRGSRESVGSPLASPTGPRASCLSANRPSSPSILRLSAEARSSILSPNARSSKKVCFVERVDGNLPPPEDTPPDSGSGTHRSSSVQPGITIVDTTPRNSTDASNPVTAQRECGA